MVFESKIGDTFLLGASSWRVEEITHDRVLVSPAPGVPGKMPFWHGENAARPLEFGRAIGALTRSLRELPPESAVSLLTDKHCLDENAARNLLHYLQDQYDATGGVPRDARGASRRARDRAVRFAVPRSGCTGALAAAQVSRPARAALADPQARRRSA